MKWLFFLVFTFSLFAQDWGGFNLETAVQDDKVMQDFDSTAVSRFKKDTIRKMEKIPGWCSKEKAVLMMDLIREQKCALCVEIGVFSGKSLLPIIKTLEFNHLGRAVAIDAWDAESAIAGFEKNDPNYEWWKKLDYNSLYNQTIELTKKCAVPCQLVRESSLQAAHLFEDETIDFIHFDGNHNEEQMYEDVLSFYPKVKEGGWMLLNDVHWISMRKALVFLLERADIVSDFSRSAYFLLLRKNKNRCEQAEDLMQ